MLKSYRTAHARVLSIDHFENALRENTPLTSINDSAALVEYLNQINLKSDMVLDELRRVSSERDTFKEELSQMKPKAEKVREDDLANIDASETYEPAGSQDEQSNETPFQHELISESVGDGSVITPKNAKAGTARPIAGVAIALPPFPSPLIAEESPKCLERTEDLFSYETELPRLETELKDRQTELRRLHDEIDRLKNDLSVARESTQSMVGTLEGATRGFQALQESKDQSDADFEERRLCMENTIQELKLQLRVKEEELREALAEKDVSSAEHKPQQQLQECQDELDLNRSRATLEIEASLRVEELLLKIKTMESENLELETEGRQNERRINTLDSLVKGLRMHLSDADDEKKRLATLVASSEKSRRTLQHRVTQLQLQSGINEQNKSESAAFVGGQKPNGELHLPEATPAGKRKNKTRKKKGSKSTTLQHSDSSSNTIDPNTHTLEGSDPSANAQTLRGELQEVVHDGLRVLLEEKDAAIEKLHEKYKREGELSEEVEMLRDDLVNVGQELMEAKDTARALLAEKENMLTHVRLLEQELAELHRTHASRIAEAAQNERELTTLEDLKMKASTLQTDLSAAQQLASSRFRDLTDLRYLLQKAQPEITALKAEVADARAQKETFGQKEAELKRSEAREAELHAEVLKLQKFILDRDIVINTLNQQIAQETTNKVRAQEFRTKTGQQIHQLETERHQTTELLDGLSRDLSKSKADLASSNVRSNELEQQILKLSRENGILREEVELKLAQYASVQNLMSSMRDQTAEMALQMKEARDRCTSLDEEVAEAHRLLGERSREAETIRRLLVGVEARADSRTRESKERMDMAIEERDRIEDEASTAQRKMTRELEDLRNRMRETERSLRRAEEDKDELGAAQRDWKKRREELDQKLKEYIKEVEEVRRAMGELRHALDESESQVRELDRERGELRTSIDDTQHRFQKLQRINKVCLKLHSVLSP